MEDALARILTPRGPIDVALVVHLVLLHPAGAIISSAPIGANRLTACRWSGFFFARPHLAAGRQDAGDDTELYELYECS